MALMSVAPGTRMLGGLSAPSTGIAEQFQAGVQANLGRQETRQAMRLREAEDKRREAEARRAQAAFEAQQAARAAAQAQRAAQQRAFAEYTRSLREAPAIPAAGVRRPVDNFVTPTAENPFPLVPAPTGVTPPFGVPLNVEPPAGVRAPVGSRISGGEDRAVLGGGAGADALPTEQPVRVKYNGFLFDVYPASGRVLNPSGGEYPDTPGYADLRAALFQLAGGVPAVPPGLPAAPVPGVVRAAGTSGAVPSTVPTSSGGVISLDALVPSYRPAFEQGLAAGPDPVHTTEGGDDYFVYSDGRVFDVENALSGGDPFDVPADVQDRLRARVGVTAAPQPAPESEVAGMFGAPEQPVTPATPAAPAVPVVAPTAVPVVPVVPAAPAAPAAGVVPPTPASAAGTVPPELQAGLERAARDPALTPEQRRAAAIQKQTLDAAAAVGGATVDMITDAAALLQTLGTGLIEYGIGVPLSVASPELGARVFDQTADWYRTADQLARMGEPLTPPVQGPPVPPGLQVSAPAETPAEIERNGQDPFITNAGPIAGLTPAGERDPVAATEAAVRAAPDQDASRYFMENPNLVLDLQTQMARERQMLEARLRYAEATQNIALYEQTFAALNSRERVVNENMISGQIAIIAAQNDNFGPLQEFLSRARPNDNVQVIPYTDGTVSFFVNGREDGPPTPVADLLEGLAQTFNTEYRDFLAKAAELQAEREQFLFENALLQEMQTRREISVAQAKVLADIEANYGKVDPVGDLPSGDKLFQVYDPEQGYVQFRIVEAGEPLVNGQPAAQATIEVVTNGSPLRR